MFYNLIYPLNEYFSFLNIFRYITFRTIYAAITALLIMLVFGKWFIAKMSELKLRQVIRQCGPESHLAKAGTPSMGGILILAAISLSTLLWADLSNIYVWLCLFVMTGFGAVGFVDDLKKINKQNWAGLSGKGKLASQTVITAIAGFALYEFGDWDTTLIVPFFKAFTPDLGFFYLVFALLVVVGASNAVNLTDGLDGLAVGPFVVASAVYTLFAYLTGHAGTAHYLQIPWLAGVGELAVFCGAMVGAGLGFLWFNSHPASIFMGDVGSLGLGGALGAVAILVKQEILLAIVGGVFVMEALSVMLQVGYFKASGGKRIFRMAPIHHHFELGGTPEPKVIVRFWIVAIILGLVAVSTLKIR